MKKTNYIRSLVCCIFLLVTNNSFSQFVPTNGPDAGSVNHLLSDGNNLYAATELGGMFLSTNNGDSWKPINNGITDFQINDIAKSGNNIFCATFSQGIVLSTDNGMSWHTVNNGFPDTHFLSVATNGTYVLAGNRNGFGAYVSTNNGNSWTLMHIDTTINIFNTFYFFDGYIYAAADSYLGFPSLPFRSSDPFSSNWTRFGNIQMRTRVNKFNSIGSTLYACAGVTIYYSHDKGDSWTGAFINGSFIGYVTGVNLFDKYIMAGFWNGFFYSSDNGATWNYPDANFMLGLYIFSTAQNSTYLFGGSGSKVWRRPVSQLTGITQINSGIPKEYSLSQNYPNPFNPSSIIKFQIAMLSNVKLTVYDILGHVIATIVNEQLKPGTYSINFDGSRFSSGIYFYKISSGDFTQTKKMLMVK